MQTLFRSLLEFTAPDSRQSARSKTCNAFFSFLQVTKIGKRNTAKTLKVLKLMHSKFDCLALSD